MGDGSWALPPGASADLVPHVWPLNLGHGEWLGEMAAKYDLGSADAALRQLIFVANAEGASQKRVIFTIVRCLHCDVSNRAGFIAKRDWSLSVYASQLQWLNAVRTRCGHKTVEKTVRIILNYYRGYALQDAAFEERLMRKNR